MDKKTRYEIERLCCAKKLTDIHLTCCVKPETEKIGEKTLRTKMNDMARRNSNS